MANSDQAFIPLDIAVLTISDTRTEAEDKSGKLLCDRLSSAGHTVHEKAIVPDDIYQIRATISIWIAQPKSRCSNHHRRNRSYW